MNEIEKIIKQADHVFLDKKLEDWQRAALLYSAIKAIQFELQCRGEIHETSETERVPQCQGSCQRRSQG